MAVLTFKPAGEVDINSKTKFRDSATTTHVKIKVPEKIRVPENHNDLIQNVANRKQECQKTINKVLTKSQFRESSTLSLEQLWEFGKESSVLAVQELCQNEYISVTDTQATNQNSCNRYSDTRNETTLLELPK
ncbi:hypothetical protein RclHR1_05370008 [Rhizophagus clarus]|nr:hypothetical protein RclHR1_05370008 [Rhizophagus clarus]